MTDASRHRFPRPPAAGQAIAVAEGIWWMRLPLPMALDHVNVCAPDDGDGWSFVDTGMQSGRMTEQWETLLDGPLAAKPVTRVILTHHHPDHIGMAEWFRGARGPDAGHPHGVAVSADADA